MCRRVSSVINDKSEHGIKEKYTSAKENPKKKKSNVVGADVGRRGSARVS